VLSCQSSDDINPWDGVYIGEQPSYYFSDKNGVPFIIEGNYLEMGPFPYIITLYPHLGTASIIKMSFKTDITTECDDIPYSAKYLNDTDWVIEIQPTMGTDCCGLIGDCSENKMMMTGIMDGNVYSYKVDFPHPENHVPSFYIYKDNDDFLFEEEIEEEIDKTIEINGVRYAPIPEGE